MSSTPPLPELAVLAPRAPALDLDTDQWPEFQLSNVDVRDPHLPDSALANLLLASANYPLRLTGRLEPLGKERAHLYASGNGAATEQRTQAIEIAHVRMFAYGEYGSGGVGIWAAGQAGWFAIKPSRAYSAIHGEMIDAIQMLYFIADAYREERRVGRGRKAQVLPEYSLHELFEKYAREVLGDASRVDAAAERIYRHREALMTSMLDGREGLAWSSKPICRHLKLKFPEDLERARARLDGRAARKTSREISPAPSSMASSGTKRKRGRPLKNSVERHDADVVSIASTSVASSVAVPGRSEPKSSKTRATLQAREPAPRGMTLASKSSSCISATPEPTTAAATPIQDSSDEPRAAPRAHKGKSALRPKPSKPAGKGKGKAPAPLSASGDDAQLAPSVSKRKSDTAPSARPAKRRNSRPSAAMQLDEGIFIPPSPSASPPASPGAQDPRPGALAQRTLHIPDPVQEDTWLCALDACSHKVYLASSAQSQRLIKEHYAAHAFDDDPRVQFVRRMAAPSLPIGHLMERVRLQAKVDTAGGAGMPVSRFPAAVGRRY